MAKKFADWRAKPVTSITRDTVEARHLALTRVSPAEANRARNESACAKGSPLIVDYGDRILNLLRSGYEAKRGQLVDL
jgi:hypothetical protein